MRFIVFKRVSVFLALLPAAAFAQPLTISTPPSLPSATVNQAYSTTITAINGVTPYQWHFQAGTAPSPRFSLSAAGVLSGTPTTADLGTQPFSIQVTDASGTTVSKQFSVSVQSTQSLTLTTVSFPGGVVGIPYSLQLTGTGGTPPYSWAVLPAIVTFPVPGQVAPGVMLNASTGIVSGSPTVAGSTSFTITLTDSANGSASKPYTLNVTPGGALGIMTTSLPNGTLGATYTQTLQAIGGVPPYQWSIASGSLPTGLSLDPYAGVIAGAPSLIGSFGFTAQATDSASTPATAKQVLSIAVAAPPALTITTSTVAGAIQNAPYSQQLAASGGVSPYRWSVTSGTLPAGLSLGATSGLINGQATATGNSTFTIQVADSAAITPNTAAKPFTIAVAQRTQLSLVSGALAGGTVNTPYSQTLPATGGAPPYAWAVVTGLLPPGMLLSGTGTLSGVPSVTGTFMVTAQATDTTGASALGTFSVAITPAQLSFAPVLLPSGIVGVPYPPQVLAAAGGAAPYTFSLQAGSTLPAGLSLNNGVIAGIPTGTGTSAFTLKATDSAQAAVSTPFQIAIRSASPPDLVSSVGALSFSLTAGATGLPDPQGIVIASSDVNTSLIYQVSVNPAAPWLTVTGGFGGSENTPGSLSVSLNSQALSLAATGSPYTTSIVLTCAASSPCSGNSQKVAVTLNISSLPPQLTLTKSIVALSAVAGSATANGTFGIANSGGGTITINSVSTGDSWLSVSGIPATLSPGPPVYATVTANTQMPPGLYRSTVNIASSAGNVNLPVTLLISGSVIITLNPVGQQFQMSAGGAVGNANGAFQILTAGASSVSWSPAALPGANWLVVKTATGSSTPSAPQSVSFSIDPVAAATLSAGAYYGTIRIASKQVANSPQDFIVVLNVAAAGTPATPDPEPSGLLFIANGSSAIPAQGITLYANSTAPTPYQAAALTASGAQWLTVTPTAGSVSAGAPGHPSISVSPAGLAPGIYRGVVAYQFSPASVRSVNVTYLIPNVGGGLPFTRAPKPQVSGTCNPANLTVTGVGIPSNFARFVAWPIPIQLLVTDDCGSPIGNASVGVTFSGTGDPALPLTPDPTIPGQYSASWAPQGAAQQVTITATATLAGFPTAKAQITGTVMPNAAPVIRPRGALNAFNLSAEGAGIAPGSWIAIFGSNFAPPGTNLILQGPPFPTAVQNISVIIGG
ncbi:MAG TPA: putative Ig domain-containing protein, partial [Bryobacteraceae bacterium]|nr:putative Ig domain-containing protein [Bryobacteraceae bacterium]